MGTDKDYVNLLYYWENWREESGAQYVDQFPDYVTLLNEAAVENG